MANNLARKEALKPDVAWQDHAAPPEILRPNDRPLAWRSSAPLIRRRHSTPRKTLLRAAATVFGYCLKLGILCALVYGGYRLSTYFTSAALPALAASAPPSMNLQLPTLAPIEAASVVHVVKSGETLGLITQRYGANWESAIAINKTLKSLAKSKGVASTIRQGQTLRLAFDPEKGLESLITQPGLGQTIEISSSGEGAYRGEVLQLPKTEFERIAYGSVSSSFASAATSVGVSYDLVDELVDLFGDRVVFHRDFRKGDRFTIIYKEELLSDGTRVGSGPILAALLEVGGQQHAAVRFVGSDKQARFFNEDGRLVGNTFLRYPLKFSRISSYFSHARMHPVLKIRRPHHGVDFAAPRGTPVRSVADGKVVFAGRKGGNGNMVKIRHNGRYQTAYLHLSAISKGVRSGAFVKRGQQIGNVGSTGLSTGPHLDFRFYDRGRSVNPLTVKLPQVDNLKKTQQIDKAELKKTLARLEQFLQKAS